MLASAFSGCVEARGVVPEIILLGWWKTNDAKCVGKGQKHRWHLMQEGFWHTAKSSGNQEDGLRWPTLLLYEWLHEKKKDGLEEVQVWDPAWVTLGETGAKRAPHVLQCPIVPTVAPASGPYAFLRQHKEWKVRKVLEMLNKYRHLGLFMMMTMVGHLRSFIGPKLNFQILLMHVIGKPKPCIFSLIKKWWSCIMNIKI